MNLLSILLQAPAGGSQWSGILMMVVIVAIFYFFMIRPQQKKQKEIQKSREALKTGDKVITAGGIYGKIVSNTFLTNSSSLLHERPCSSTYFFNVSFSAN